MEWKFNTFRISELRTLLKKLSGVGDITVVEIGILNITLEN